MPQSFLIRIYYLSFKIDRLIAETKIYVSQFTVTNAVNRATSCSTLARNLLPAVFTDAALKVCNSTGKNGAKAARLMLHQGGIESIFSFVETHAEKNTNWCPDGWTKAVKDAVKTSVQKKLNENHKAHQMNVILNAKRV